MKDMENAKMKEYGVQVKYSENGKWLLAGERTFKTKNEAADRIKEMQVEHEFSCAYLPHGYKNDYVKFRIVARNVSEWKEVKFGF